MTSELQNKLLKKYPNILKSLQWEIECGDGWFWLIDNLCHKIDQINNSLSSNQGIYSSQIKEKFGGLRFYTNYSNEKIDDFIKFAEFLSYKICEKCGSTQNVTQNKKGWIKTLCKNCKNVK